MFQVPIHIQNERYNYQWRSYPTTNLSYGFLWLHRIQPLLPYMDRVLSLALLDTKNKQKIVMSVHLQCVCVGKGDKVDWPATDNRASIKENRSLLLLNCLLKVWCAIRDVSDENETSCFNETHLSQCHPNECSPFLLLDWILFLRCVRNPAGLQLSSDRPYAWNSRTARKIFMKYISECYGILTRHFNSYLNRTNVMANFTRKPACISACISLKYVSERNCEQKT
jgi:hypothetical protein